jgi:Tfp pilus assembly protein PilN
MMKINLLGQSTAAAATRRAAAPTTSTQQVLVLVVALAVSMGIVGFLYYYWGNQVKQEQADLAREQTRQKELAGVQAQNALYRKQLAQLQERIDTIQKLQTSRTGPVDMMTGIGDVVNVTHNLYLTSVQPAGNTLHIQGIASRVDSIADFIRALKNSPKFDHVLLEKYFQNNRQNQVSYEFTLECEYKPPAPPQPAGAAGGPAQPTAAGRPAGK